MITLAQLIKHLQKLASETIDEQWPLAQAKVFVQSPNPNIPCWFTEKDISMHSEEGQAPTIVITGSIGA